MNHIFNGTHVRDRGRDGWNPIGKKGILLTFFRHGDVTVNRILIVNNIHPTPLGPDQDPMDLLRCGRDEQDAKEEGKDE